MTINTSCAFRALCTDSSTDPKVKKETVKQASEFSYKWPQRRRSTPGQNILRHREPHLVPAASALKGIAERAPEVLERLGLTYEHVIDKCLRPLLQATKTEFFASNGLVMEEKQVAALDIRLRAIDTWAKLAGAYSVQKVNLTGNLNITHASDEELDQAIADLLVSAQQTPKA
jgi:hypothetical protein